MAFQKGNTFGNRFSSTNQPENNGRKPRIFSILKKQYGIDVAANGAFTPGEIKDLLQSLLCVDIRQTQALAQILNQDMRKISEVVKAGGKPEKLNKTEVISQVFVALSQAISRETAKGESGTIRWIIEYLFGRPTQPIEGDLSINKEHDLSALTTEELMLYNDLLSKISNGKQ